MQASHFWRMAAGSVLTICMTVAVMGPALAQTRPPQDTISSIDRPDLSWQPYWRDFERAMGGNAPAFKYRTTESQTSESNVLVDVQRGRVQLGALSLTTLSEVVPEIAVLSAPFLFENEQVAAYAFDSTLLTAINDLLSGQGLEVLDWTEIGWVHVATDRPISLPSDLRDLTLRISNNAAEREFVATLGASPLALKLDEIKAAMAYQASAETTSQLNGGLIGIGGHYYVTSDHWKYLTLTSHSYEVGVFVANKDWVETLSDSRQASIRAALSATTAARDERRKQIGDSLEFMTSTGAEIRTLTEDERRAWVIAGLAAHGPILMRIGGRAQFLYDAVNTAKESFLENAQKAAVQDMSFSTNDATGSVDLP